MNKHIPIILSGLLCICIISGCNKAGEDKFLPDKIVVGDSLGEDVIYKSLTPYDCIDPYWKPLLFLDVNHDGIDDLYFREDHYWESEYDYFKYFVYPLSEEIEFLVDSTGLKVAEFGDEIHNDGTFVNRFGSLIPFVLYRTHCYHYYYYDPEYVLEDGRSCRRDGNWENVSGKYMVFRLQTGDRVYLGWIRMGFISTSRFEVDAYAIQQVAMY